MNKTKEKPDRKEKKTALPSTPSSHDNKTNKCYNKTKRKTTPCLPNKDRADREERKREKERKRKEERIRSSEKRKSLRFRPFSIKFRRHSFF